MERGATVRRVDKITMTVVWVFAVFVVAVVAAGIVRWTGLPFGSSNIMVMPFALYAGFKVGAVWNA